MNLNLSKKIIFFIVFSAVILAYYQTLRIDAPEFEKKLIRHTSIINNTAEYPYKYRLLNPYITHLYFTAIKLFLPEKASFLLAYLVQNLLVYVLLFFAVYNLFSIWFDDTGALVGMLIFALLIPLSLTGYDTLGDMTTAMLMAIGFSCISHSRIYVLYPVIFIGTFNEMQIIMLIVFYFIGMKKNLTYKKAWLNAIGLSLTFLLAYAIIYMVRGGQAGKEDFVWFFTKDASFNISHKNWVVQWFLMIAPFLYFVFKDFKLKPEFLKRNLLFTLPIFYFGAFFFIGRLREIDKALTIFLVLIPLALFSAIPSQIKKS
jgi:hypothetical protein